MLADAVLEKHKAHWLVRETIGALRRTLARLDVTSRSLIALVEPGSCFAGPLLELLLACDRQYMLEGIFTDADDADSQTAPTLIATRWNFGAFPMGNGLSRLESRFYGDSNALEAARAKIGEPLDAAAAEQLGLITYALDDIDWEDDVRIALEERASMSPDALTGMEANHRFVGPETLETKIFGRLTAWQNWIFIRPNAVGPEGALRKYGTGQKAVFDRKRV
jgi:benzoyl-CoA-dihydrodiol lyase